MSHLDWSKDGEKLQSTSRDYELLFCKSRVLLTLHIATEHSKDTSAVVETNKPLTSCTNARRKNTPRNFHYHYPFCSSCQCSSKVVFSADIWVASQEDIAANEETLKQCKVI